MTDKYTKEARSYNMARIRGKNTKPELSVRKFLFSKGFRYRLHDKKLPGTPDIILPLYKTVIFINGCFWHGHVDCDYATIPNTRTEWWAEKIKKTRNRDQINIKHLSDMGWTVITIYGCELKPKTIDPTLKNLVAFLQSLIRK